MKQYVTDYINYLNGMIAEYHRKEEELKLDDRKDESILYKVRVNICDIFLKMVTASDKKIAAMKLASEEEQLKAFNEDYLNWFVKIPASWKANMELAKKHDDVLVVETEEIKLETAELLRMKFLELSGYMISIGTEASKSTKSTGGVTLHIDCSKTANLADRVSTHKVEGKPSEKMEGLI